jgi:hypothetical protein
LPDLLQLHIAHNGLIDMSLSAGHVAHSGNAIVAPLHGVVKERR